LAVEEGDFTPLELNVITSAMLTAVGLEDRLKQVLPK